MTVLSELEMIKMQYAMLLKELHHVEHKLAILERSKKDQHANENLIAIGDQLKVFFERGTTQEIMDELRGD